MSQFNTSGTGILTYDEKATIPVQESKYFGTIGSRALWSYRPGQYPVHSEFFCNNTMQRDEQQEEDWESRIQELLTKLPKEGQLRYKHKIAPDKRFTSEQKCSQLCIGIDPYRWLQLGDTFYVDPPQVPLNRIWKYNIPEVRIFSALLSHPSRTKDVEKAAFFFRGPISQFSFVSTCPDELYRYGQSPPLNTVTIAPNDDMEDLCGWNEYAIWRASMSSVYSPRCHISVGDPTHSFNLGPPYMGNRPLKACFKGQRYPGADSPFSDVRGQLYQLFHGSTDIVVRTKCHAYYYDKLADATEKSQCDSQALEYDARPGEYEVFMQSCKFSLVPRGRGLHSYRLIESMAWGAIPVIVADTYVLPFADIIDWSQFSVVVEEKDIAKLPAILRNYSDTQLDVMRERAWKAYQKHFQSAAVWVDTGFKQLLYRVNETLQSMSPS